MYDLGLLTANKSEQIYKKGDVIFRLGGFHGGIFYIIDGKDQIIYEANSGVLVGYHAMLSEDHYPDCAATLEESRIAFIPKEDFLEILNQSKILSLRLLKTFSHQFALLANSLMIFA